MLEYQNWILQRFRSYLKRSRLNGTHYLVFKLNLIIREWLARDECQYDLKVSELAVHEVVELIEFLETSIRKTWTANSARSRAATKKRKLRQALKNAQMGFKF